MLEWLALNAGLLIAGYLFGSIPTGYAIGKWFYGIDLRTEGSGSTGATNVLRTCGKFPALMVLLIDVLKGVFAIALVYWIYSLTWTHELAETLGIEKINDFMYWMATFAGLTAVVGHTKSFWINFQGGKSVASSLGILLALNWVLALATLGIFALTLAISRIVSLSSIAGAIGMAILMIATAQPLPYQIFGVATGIYVIWRHRTNIERLLQGTEPRIGQKLAVQETEDQQIIAS